MIDRIAYGRTDLVFDYLGEGHLATSKDSNGTFLIEWYAYYGDVSAISSCLLTVNHYSRCETILATTPLPSTGTGGSANSSSRTATRT